MFIDERVSDFHAQRGLLEKFLGVLIGVLFSVSEINPILLNIVKLNHLMAFYLISLHFKIYLNESFVLR